MTLAIASILRGVFAGAVVVAALMIQVTQAAAVSSDVRNACMSDYFSYCSQHEVGSQALRACMRNNGPKLSTGCVNALVSSGEVSKAEVNRRSASATPRRITKVNSKISSKVSSRASKVAYKRVAKRVGAWQRRYRQA